MWPSLKVPPPPSGLSPSGLGHCCALPLRPPLPALPPTLAPIQKFPSFLSRPSQKALQSHFIRIVPKEVGVIDAMIPFLLLILLALYRAGQACFQRSEKGSIYLFFLANRYQSKRARGKEHRSWQEKVAWASLSLPAPVGGLVSSSVKWVPMC